MSNGYSYNSIDSLELNSSSSKVENEKPGLNNINSWTLRVSLVFVYYLVGLVFYSNAERWNVIDCLYFITISGALF